MKHFCNLTLDFTRAWEHFSATVARQVLVALQCWKFLYLFWTFNPCHERTVYSY